MKQNSPWQMRLRSGSYFQDIEEEAMHQAFLTSAQRADTRRETTLSRTSEQSDDSTPRGVADSDLNPIHSSLEKGSRPPSKQQDLYGEREVSAGGGYKKVRKFDGEDIESDEIKIKKELPPLIRNRFFNSLVFLVFMLGSCKRSMFVPGTLDILRDRGSMNAISG
jgi:hypothetical protein